jgi:hypothetical protein
MRHRDTRCLLALLQRLSKNGEIGRVSRVPRVSGCQGDKGDFGGFRTLFQCLLGLRLGHVADTHNLRPRTQSLVPRPTAELRTRAGAQRRSVYWLMMMMPAAPLLVVLTVRGEALGEAHATHLLAWTNHLEGEEAFPHNCPRLYQCRTWRGPDTRATM